MFVVHFLFCVSYWSSFGSCGLTAQAFTQFAVAVACLTAVREVPGSNRAVGSYVYRKRPL